MTVALRLLVVEDSELDAVLLLETLALEEFVVTHRRVETAAQLREALTTAEWDCLISDFSLPVLRAPEVLQILAESGHDLPCIVVSGTIGEEAAVQVLTAGASDFLVKGSLARLGPAIRRELREAEQRKKRRQAETALRESEKNFRALFESSPVPMWAFDTATLHFLEVNAAALNTYGYARDEFLAMRTTDIRPAEDVSCLSEDGVELPGSPAEAGLWRHRLKSGQCIWVEITSHPLTFAGRDAQLVAAVDCTARLEAQRLLEERGTAAALTADIGVALNRSESLDACLQRCADALGERFGGSVARIWTTDRRGELLERCVTAGVSDGDQCPPARMPIGASRIGRIASERRIWVSGSVLAGEDTVDGWPAPQGAQAFAGYPLMVKNRLVGVLALYAQRSLGEATLAALAAIADQIALGIERYRTEAESRQLAAIVENSDDPILSMTADGTIVNWNGAAERVYGFSHDEAVGQSIMHITSPEGRLQCAEILEGLRRGEHLKRFQTVRRRQDGSMVPMSLTFSPIRDTEGRVIGGSSIGHDISERLRSEQLLSETEERMRFALEASRVGIWEADMSTGASRWSETCEALHGLAPGSFSGSFQDFAKCVHPDDRERTLQTIEESTRQRTDANLLYRTVWPDGTVRWISGTGRTYYDDNGVPLRAAGISFDVTERRALEAQYLESQKMEAIGQLAGGVAHDFNNLLTAILGYGNLLLERIDQADPLCADVHEIVRAGESAAALTRQLLAFGRRQVMQPKVLTVNAIVGDVERLLARLIGENVKLVSRLQPHLDPVMADPGQLEQVLVNLAVNARDAMPNGGVLTIETANVELDDTFSMGHFATVPGPYVQVTVSDTGVGMDAEVQQRLFEPFFTTKAAGKGTGLGLATVYGIVKQSRGQIYVYSELGRGTAFKIYFPVTTAEGAPRAIERPVVPSPAGGSETVLVVEDNDAARRLARAVLVRQGYQVLDVPSGEDAIRLLDSRSLSVDLVVTDIVMTGMTGIELARRLAVSRPNLRMLLTSGYSNDFAFRHEQWDGETRFLEKPYTPSVLARAVREALDAGGASAPHDRAIAS